ncbi:MAG TPA: cyclic nucleotide-binding domain-containing protein [Anaeromyxobacter sp.]|nr:cyclic nucleotide-binding domain-containing protein [Anaeromyxobacter sp.]
MADVRTLKDRAAEAAARGKLAKAADLYREALRGEPGDVATRQKLAEVLRRDGRTAEAVEAYRSVADRFARDGLLIKAIAISKAILELDPERVETQAALAALYARRAAAQRARPPARTVVMAALASPAAAPPREDAGERVVAIPLGPGPVSPPPREATEVVPLEALVEEPQPRGRQRAGAITGFQEIRLAAGEAIAAGVEEDVVLDLDAADELARAPAAAATLPRFPIFSELSREAFVALTRAMSLRRVGRGDVVLREGEGGTSFYVIATGRLAVSRRDERGEPVVLARLGEGDFFGEMALLSGAPRAATVVAEEPSELLEFGAGALLGVARAHPHLAASLRGFYRQRLLANAMAVSPIFRPFPKGDRKLIMERFRSREVVEGETVIREGDPSDGLYVVLEGAVDVVKRKDGATVAVGQLREGDVFGEMSCLRKAPASATVVVRRRGALLKLPRSDFDELVATYPQILELVAELSEERAENLDAILTGHAQWTDEGLVLV